MTTYIELAESERLRLIRAVEHSEGRTMHELATDCIFGNSMVGICHLCDAVHDSIEQDAEQAYCDSCDGAGVVGFLRLSLLV